MSDAPTQSYPLLRKFLPARLQPIIRGIRKRLARRSRSLSEPYYSVFPYAQASLSRQQNLVALSKRIESESIPGAIVECGVLDGGTAALMAHSTKSRPVHLFDSWEGLPKVFAKDGNGAMWVGQVVGSPRRVVNIMRKLGVDLNRITFHRGWFSDTFPKATIERIALLHIDADFYDSVRLCLERWYPHITPGGFIQFDDYDIFIGCTRAVDEFLAQHPELKLQSHGDEAKVYYLRKPTK